MIATTSFLDLALNAVERYGFSIIPRAKIEKEPIHGKNLGPFSKTNTREGVEAFAARIPEDANYSIVSDDNFTILESDNETEFRALVRKHSGGKELPVTLTSYGRPNHPHWFYKRTPACNVRPAPKVHGIFEWRNNSQYVAGFGSMHHSGVPYTLVDPNAPIVDFPEWLPAVLKTIKKSAPPTDTSRKGKGGAPDRDGYQMIKTAYMESLGDPESFLDADRPLDLIIGEGGQHYTAYSVVAGILHDGERTKEEILDYMYRFWELYCVRKYRTSDNGEDIEIAPIVVDAMKLKPCSHNFDPWVPCIDPKFLYSVPGKHCIPYQTQEAFDAGVKDILLKEFKTAEEKTPVPPFRTQSIVDFLEKKFSPPEHLIENVLLLGDFTSLTGRRRNGKTTLLHNMALAGACGDKSYLGFKILRPFKTLAFYLEDDPGDMQDKLRTMLTGRKANDNFHLYTKLDFRQWEIVMDLANPGFRNRVIECCSAHKPDWVTFDNLGILIGADYNNAKAIHEVVKFMWDLQGIFRCAVTVAAHPRKQSNDIMEKISLTKDPPRFFEECMGSSHFINSTGAMWGIERGEDERTHLVLGSQRVTGDHAVTIAEKDDNHWLQQVHDLPAAMRTLLNTDRRKKAWGLFPETFTYQMAFDMQAGTLSNNGFSKWWKELRRNNLLVPAGGLCKNYRKAVESIPVE
jgi:hypothetical protein